MVTWKQIDKLMSRRLMCANCLEHPAVKHLIRPLDLFLCMACFMQMLRNMKEGDEIIQEDIPYYVRQKVD